MKHESSKSAWPRIFGWLIIVVSTFAAEAAAVQYSALGPGAWVSVTSVAGPDVCSSLNWPRPPLPLYAPGVGVQSRLVAYPVMWPVPRGPFGTRVVPSYLSAPAQVAVIGPYGVRPRPLGRLPAALIDNSLARSYVFPRQADCRVR
jgi:hypothetical protein